MKALVSVYDRPFLNSSKIIVQHTCMKCSPLYIQDNNTRYATLRLCQPYRKTIKRQKGLSYLGPSLWKKIDRECKLIANLNTFKHSHKKQFQLVKNEVDIHKLFLVLVMLYVSM